MSADRGKLEVDVLHAKAEGFGRSFNGDWLLVLPLVAHVAIETISAKQYTSSYYHTYSKDEVHYGSLIYLALENA